MLLIGILSLILYSSYKNYTIKDLKEFIVTSILLIIYTIIILWNSSSLLTIGKGLSLFNNTFLLTPYTISIKFLLLILVILYFIIIYHYMQSSKSSNIISKYININNPGSEFIILILLNIFAMSLFIEAGNSLIIFIAIELQSYTLYIITTTYYKEADNTAIYSAKSGLIYFLLGSLASIMILIGLALLYSETGLYNITDIMIYLNTINLFDINNLIISISLILIFIGLLFKIGIAPLHNWLINIYNNVPTIITIWISLVTKISILTFIYTLLHLFNIIYINNNNVINILQFIAILSMIIGGIGGLSQISIKKLLAYSGLTNSGYMLYGIIANNQYTLLAYIFNIYQYSLTHINIFLLILLSIIYYNSWYINNRISNNINNNISIKYYMYINDLYCFITRNRCLTLCYIICLTSFMGIPPLAGFYGKYYLLVTGLLSGYWFSALILITVSCFTAYYYGYIIKTLLFSDNNVINKYMSLINNNNNINISYTLSYIISLLSLLILMPLLVLDLYINGVVILDYYQWII
jgi:NADH-ubiquinone oxidoreductase chain 2